MKITVTAPQPAEQKQWRALYNAYAEFYRVPMNDDIAGRVWQWIHDSTVNLNALIAKDETGTLIGLMHYREELSPLRGAVVGFLDDLFVVPSHRGTGITAQLFAALKTEAQKKGWPFIRWRTAEDNYRARAAYDRLSEKTKWLTYQMNTETKTD